MSDDNILKRITIALFGKDEGATKLLGDVDRRVDGLDNKLKTFGKITNIGAFRQFSDIAEGFDKSLGALGKIASAVAIGEVAGRTMKALGDGISAVVEGSESFTEALDKIGSKIPVLGTFKTGFESLAVGIAKAEAAALGFDTAVAGRRGSIAARSMSIFGLPSAIGDAVGELSGEANATAASKKLDERTKLIRDMITANNRDLEESKRIARTAMNDRQRIEAEAQDKLEAIEKRRYEWSVRNGGLTVEAQKRFADDEITVRRDANNKIVALIERGNEAIRKAEEERAKIEREALEETLRIQRETTGLQSQFAIGLMGDTPNGQIAASRQKLKDDLDEINRKIEEVRRTETNYDIRDARIAALRRQGETLSVQQGIDERMINARAVSDVDRRFRENAMIVAMARSEQARLQREQEDAGRLTSFETQQRARTSNMDGRGVTGFFNQSKSIEDSGRKTADNTKATADAVKAVSSTLDKLFTGGAFISL